MNLKKETILVIDARHANETMDGLGRYVLELLNGLSTQMIPYTIVLHTSAFPFKYLLNKEVYKFHQLNIPGSNPKQHFVVPSVLKKLKADIYYYPFIDPPLLSPAKKNFFAVHDLNHFFFSKYAATERKAAILMAKFFIHSAALIYDNILVFSKYVEKQLNENVKASQGKTKAIYHGFSAFPQDENDVSDEKVIAKNSYILYVGNNRPHKNLTRLFEAFKIVTKNNNIKLVVVGNQIPRFFDLKKNIEDSNLKEKVIVISKASNTYLKKLYTNALFVVYPSLSEGFGLPLLEAWNFKVVIATSNSTCIPEIAGDAAAFFDPYDYKDMASVMDKLINNPDWRQILIDKGSKRLENFTWKKSSEEHLKLFTN